MHADKSKKIIALTHLPQPEVLSLEPHLEFYDIKNGIFNTFSSEDLTQVNQEAREHILDKIPGSRLMDTARNEALQAVLMIEKIVETIGWKLDYKALEIPEERKKRLT